MTLASCRAGPRPVVPGRDGLAGSKTNNKQVEADKNDVVFSRIDTFKPQRQQQGKDSSFPSFRYQLDVSGKLEPKMAMKIAEEQHRKLQDLLKDGRTNEILISLRKYLLNLTYVCKKGYYDENTLRDQVQSLLRAYQQRSDPSDRNSALVEAAIKAGKQDLVPWLGYPGHLSELFHLANIAHIYPKQIAEAFFFILDHMNNDPSSSEKDLSDQLTAKQISTFFRSLGNNVQHLSHISMRRPDSRS